jgi:hypothetical protein
MNLHIRKATLINVPRLWELRRNSIIELAPDGMAIARCLPDVYTTFSSRSPVRGELQNGPEVVTVCNSPGTGILP